MRYFVGVSILIVIVSTIYTVEGRGRGGGRGGRGSRTGSRHSAINQRFSAVGITRNPVRLIAILPIGSHEINSYPAREGYFPCPRTGDSFQLPIGPENGGTEDTSLQSDLQNPNGQINDVLTINQFIYICFNETKPQDEPIDVFDTAIAVVVILLIFGLLFDLTRRAANQAPTLNPTPPPRTQARQSVPIIDYDHIERIQRMARSTRRGSEPGRARTSRRPTILSATMPNDEIPAAISPTASSRKSSEDKPPSYSEIAIPPPSYEESMRVANVRMNQNAQRLLKR